MASARGAKDFLGKPAPPGYIAGLGRGATGFITRPDLGPGSSISTPAVPATEDDRPELLVANEEGLLASRGPQGAEDDEADAIFATIEQRMAQRRRARKPAATAARSAHDPNDPLTLFAAEKLKLCQVTANEWAQLPESGDFRAKRMKKTNERERYTPVPDSVILGASSLGSGGSGGALDDNDTDFRNVGESRERILGARIDMSIGGPAASAGPLSRLDPDEYLSGLESSAQRAPQINDLRRARTLLRAAVQSNPTNPAAWISAAKIEEVAGNPKRARELLADALAACPDSEDIWMEAVRLAPPEEGGEILSRALIRLPSSAKLWILTAEREGDPVLAKRALRRALEANPEAPTIWKALIEREEDLGDARILLNKALECCPTTVDFWIALARLESRENARRILNKARQANPLSVDIWLAAARLEEAHGDTDGMVERILQRAVKELAQKGAVTDRARWLGEAASCEDAGDLLCARALAVAASDESLALEHGGSSSGLSLEALLNEAKAAASARHPVVAKSLLEQALKRCRGREQEALVWTEIVDVDPREDVLRTALGACPASVDLWLKYASLQGVDRAAALQEACSRNPGHERLWICLGSELISRGQHEEARQMFARVCQQQGHFEKLWKDRIQLERFLNGNASSSLIKTALELFPRSERIWRLAVRLEGGGELADAALAACPNSPPVLVEVARQVAKTSPIRARAILEKGRHIAPDDALLWLAAIKLEMAELEAPGQARTLMSRALQRCPLSEPLWYEAIQMEARPLRKAKAMEALRRCGQQAPLILLAIARLMEAERNLDSAQEYYQRAIAAGRDMGDCWGHYWRFLRKHGLEGTDKLLAEAILAKPRDGPLWRDYRKEIRWWWHPIEKVFSHFLQALEARSE